MRYDIPLNAKKIGPGNTREPEKKRFNFFLPGLEISEKSLIAREVYYGGQLVERALYKDGVEHGVQRSWHQNGQARSEAPFKNGVMHGTFRHWNETGQLIGQYEITNGNGIRKIYNAVGYLVHEQAIANSRGNGLRMEMLLDGVRSLISQKDGQIIGKSYSVYPSGSLSSLSCSSASGFSHGPRLDFSKEGVVTTKQWFVSNKEVTESEYAAAASNDPSLPAYLSEVGKYKELAESEIEQLLVRYRNLPRVKIPLQFDDSGDLVLAR